MCCPHSAVGCQPDQQRQHCSTGPEESPQVRQDSAKVIRGPREAYPPLRVDSAKRLSHQMVKHLSDDFPSSTSEGLSCQGVI